jgi:protocatechuate 3,4-dioxygenase beta subunit
MPSINVRVVSSDDNKPIGDALVRFPWSDTTHDHRTDADGRVLLRCLTPEVWHIEVHAKGFAEKEVPVNLVGTDAAEVTIELDAGGAGVLFGTITDETGRPIAGAGFSVFPANFRGRQIEYLQADAEGKYRFDYLPVNQGLELSVSGEGFVDLRRQTTLSAGSPLELNLVLQRRPHGGTVSGSVSDTAGNPIAGATLTNRGRSSRHKRTATTDELGIFVLDDVYERAIGHELVVQAQGFAPQQLKFKPGTPDKPAKLAITLADGHRIRGRVVDESGKAIRGVAVYFANGNRGSGMDYGGKTTTGVDGRFEFDSLPEVCPFAFVADGYSEIEDARLPLDGDEEVVVTMQTEGVVKGRVVDAKTGQPITPFNVQITFSPDRKPGEPGHHLGGPRATSPDGERFANDQGIFTLKDLIRDMPLQVTVTADGYDKHIKRRVVAASESAAETVEFRLQPVVASDFFTISGRIVDTNDRPITGAELRLISTTDFQLPAAMRDPHDFSFVEYPFGWTMIRSGSAEKAAGVQQYLSTTSDETGEFAFEQVRPAAAMQIAYWGEGVTQGRVQGIEQMSEVDRALLKIEVVTPGVVRGKIDRTALPDINSVAVSPKGLAIDSDIQHAFLQAGESTYEIRNVPPGKYQLQVYGELVRVPGTDGYRQDVVQRHELKSAPEKRSRSISVPRTQRNRPRIKKTGEKREPFFGLFGLACGRTVTCYQRQCHSYLEAFIDLQARF